MTDYYLGDILVETEKTDKKRTAGILAAYGAGLDRKGGKEKNDGV